MLLAIDMKAEQMLVTFSPVPTLPHNVAHFQCQSVLAASPLLTIFGCLKQLAPTDLCGYI